MRERDREGETIAVSILVAVLLVLTGLFLYNAAEKSKPGRVLDEAGRVGRQPDSSATASARAQ